jgi:cell division protein FtsW
MKFIKKNYHQPDYVLIGILSFLVVFGLVVLSSAGAALGYEKFGDNYYYLKHQVVYGLIPGILLFIITSKVNYNVWKKISLLLFILSIISLVLVFIPGINFSAGGAARWINIGGFIFQPAEIVKLSLIIYLAAWLEKKGAEEVGNFNSGFLPFVVILGLIMTLIILQPDMGTMMVMAAIAIAMYIAGGAKINHVILLGLIGVLLLLLLIKVAPYRADRLMTFLHPELDPQGKGYHINQAFLAIGSGGFFGRGFGQSLQKYLYLPEVAGDSIFAVMAEELGFIAGLLVIGAYIFLMRRGFKMAKIAPDAFARLLTVGIISWFVFQAFINIGAMCGALPLTGIPLPFVSYGGTSLAISLAAIGILINISKQTKEI